MDLVIEVKLTAAEIEFVGKGLDLLSDLSIGFDDDIKGILRKLAKARRLFEAGLGEEA